MDIRNYQLCIKHGAFTGPTCSRCGPDWNKGAVLPSSSPASVPEARKADKLGAALLPLATEKFAKQNPVQGPPRQARTKRTVPEAEFEMMLEARRQQGQIRDYFFQGITLRIGDGAKYTPDFFVMNMDDSATLIETKGPFIRDKGLMAWRAAKDRYGRIFTFEMHQRAKGGVWTKIL